VGASGARFGLSRERTRGGEPGVVRHVEGKGRGGGSSGTCARARRGGPATDSNVGAASTGSGQRRGSRAGELKGKATLAGRPRPQCRAAVLNSF
jgi:hypothetical protein